MEEEKDLIAYCGLYCGDCFGYKGKIADLARDLRKELRQTKFSRIAQTMSETPFFAVYKDYPQCYEVLGAMVKFRCKRTCRGGGGPPVCKIRSCCQKKGIDGCWQCDEFEKCQKFESFRTIHGDSPRQNLRAIRKFGLDKWVEHRHKCYIWQ